MNIVIRADASINIGTGHVMRCLTLAEELKQQGSKVEFICCEHKGNLIKRIEQQGFPVHKLALVSQVSDLEKPETDREKLYGSHWLGSTQQQDAEQCKAILEKIKPDWLIVDHYGIDQAWQLLLKENYKKLMVIDDLADRVHQCDLLLDQTYGRNKKDYFNLVPEHCQMLLGSQYALLRPEFAEWRDYSLKRRAKPELKKLLITMGGVDPDNITGQVLDALKTCKLPQELEITVVLGETAPNIERVKVLAQEMLYKTQVKTNVDNMAELMAHSDLAIGAAGATTWERCCLGLPSIVMGLVDNQKDILTALANKHIIVTIDKERVDEGIKVIETLSEKLLEMLSKNSIKVVDGICINQVTESINLGAY